MGNTDSTNAAAASFFVDTIGGGFQRDIIDPTRATIIDPATDGWNQVIVPGAATFFNEQIPTLITDQIAPVFNDQIPTFFNDQIPKVFNEQIPTFVNEQIAPGFNQYIADPTKEVFKSGGTLDQITQEIDRGFYQDFVDPSDAWIKENSDLLKDVGIDLEESLVGVPLDFLKTQYDDLTDFTDDTLYYVFLAGGLVVVTGVAILIFKKRRN